LHTFSAVFPDSPEADESAFSQAVAEKSHVVAHQIRPGIQSPLADLPQVLEAVTEPFYAPNFFIASGVTRSAQSNGLRILLDGTDGDTAVGHGVDLLREAAASHDWALFSREADAVTRLFDSRTYATRAGIFQAHALPELQRLARSGRWLALFQGANVIGKALGLGRKKMLAAAMVFGKSRGSSIPDVSYLNPDFVARAQGVERLREFGRDRAKLLTGRRTSQWQSMTSGAIPVVLESFDRIGAMHGVEYRYPFCDRELIEFCLAMPSHLQLRDGWSRWILRKGMSKCLPEPVCWRGGKANLSPIFDRGLRLFEPDRLEHLGHTAPEWVLDYVSGDALFQAFHQFIGQEKKLGRNLLWRAAVLETWQKRKNVEFNK
jgi:asparagine synthase (glutamine-hydrolysing)